ncbi:MAG: MlaD family protein [Gammaproteobacteria bacterium]|nr:MlaD family protein [Gammaproteobacteria bacterium]
MITRTQKVRLGIFVFVAIFVLMGTLIALTGGRFSEKRDFYTVRLTASVSGLEVGSTVKYNGVQIGRVESLRVDPERVSATLVEISVLENTPVKQDTRAVASALGITGLKYIELVKSTDASPRLPVGSDIPEELSLVENLSGKAAEIALKTELILNNIAELTNTENRQKMVGLVERADTVLMQFETLLNDTTPQLSSLTSNLSQSAATLNQTLKSTNELVSGFKTDQKNLTSVLKNTNGAVADARALMKDSNLAETLTNANRVFSNLNVMLIKNQENLSSTLEQANQISENLNDFSRVILENPSALFLGVKEEENQDSR